MMVLVVMMIIDDLSDSDIMKSDHNYNWMIMLMMMFDFDWNTMKV
jgi:hypothetical protein